METDLGRAEVQYYLELARLTPHEEPSTTPEIFNKILQLLSGDNT